jgi:hypothetical protein
VLKVHAKNALTLIDEHRKLQEAHAELANELQQAQEQLHEQADLEQQLQQALQDKAAEAAKARKAEQQLQHQVEELAQLKALHQADELVSRPPSCHVDAAVSDVCHTVIAAMHHLALCSGAVNHVVLVCDDSMTATASSMTAILDV